jgi:hypothetical protein
MLRRRHQRRNPQESRIDPNKLHDLMDYAIIAGIPKGRRLPFFGRGDIDSAQGI